MISKVCSDEFPQSMGKFGKVCPRMKKDEADVGLPSVAGGLYVVVPGTFPCKTNKVSSTLLKAVLDELCDKDVGEQECLSCVGKGKD